MYAWTREKRKRYRFDVLSKYVLARPRPPPASHDPTRYSVLFSDRSAPYDQILVLSYLVPPKAHLLDSVPIISEDKLSW
ncbi:hypothetical protein RSAG8_10082, partial [Rhizoctonia solani AG-8 WAC10335]